MDPVKLKKIAVGALIAAGGALLTYVTDSLPLLDIPEVLLPAVTAVLSVAVNALRKYAGL